MWQRVQEVWQWVAIDVATKVIAAVELGARTQVSAHRLIHGMKRVLAENCLLTYPSTWIILMLPVRQRRKSLYRFENLSTTHRRRRPVGLMNSTGG
jgi:IS1 family transposase